MSFLSTLGDVLSAGASFIPGIGGPIASALGNVVSKQGARQEQQELNAAQFQFSHDEAQAQRDFQERMMDKANLYNSPANQIKLMQEAGINPNTFNTGISGSATAGTGAAASSPAGVGLPSLVSAQSELISAQSRLASAEAAKAKSETKRTEALLPGELSIQGMTLNLGDAQTSFTQAQTDEVRSNMQVALAKIRNLDEQTQSIIQSREVTKLDIKEREIMLKEFEERLHYELLQKKSQLRLDDYAIKHIVSQIALNYANVSKVGAETDVLRDTHLLNGVQLQYAGDTYQLNFDKMMDEYKVTAWRNKTALRISKKRASSSYVNDYLDTLDILTGIVGNVFGSIPQYLNKSK